MKEQLKKMRFKGLCCGVAPVYLEIYQEKEDSPMICAMTPRPMTGWVWSITTWMWDFVAWASNKQDFTGQYPIRITGENPRYEQEDDDDFQDREFTTDD